MSTTVADEDRFQRMVGQRIRIAREQAGMTQESLSKLLGFKDRQTLSYIEAGRRKVTADELVRLMEVFKKPLEFFTSSLLLIGEVAISWRAKHAPDKLADFEQKQIPIVGLYRELARQTNETRQALVPQLMLTSKSAYEDAEAAAGHIVKEWELGNIPARTLQTAAQDRLNLLLLNVDAPPEISGAAIRLPEFDTILINRKDPPGRRNYDFGHELFHLLTWQSMPPDRIDQETEPGTRRKRIEQLAEAFTSALLMPEESVETVWSARGDEEIHAWIRNTAAALGVSGRALFWRLRNLGLLKAGDAIEIDLDRLAFDGRDEKPKLYSRKFVDCLHKGLDRGLISVRRAAGLLDCTIEDLEDLFRDYGFEPPFAL